MSKLIILIFITLPWIASSYDLFSGLLQLNPEGCFENVNTYDSANCNRNLSLSQVFTPPYNKGTNTNPMDTKCFLFTPKNPYKAELLHKCGGMLPEKTDFDPTIDTIVITHGYAEGLCRGAWMREFGLQYMKRGRYNVLQCDYTWGNSFDPFSTAANALVAGQGIGFMLKNIMLQTNISGKKFQLIGHSFGCHAISAAAKYLLAMGPRFKVRRLTWLEPLTIPFPNEDPRSLFDYRDADFTDSYHSGSGICFPGRISSLKPIGHVDFYFDGGRTNFAWVPYFFTSLAKGDLFYASFNFIPGGGFHLQMIQYYKVSINPPGEIPYIGVECDSYTSFQNGSCKRCCLTNFQNCAVAGADAEKYYNPAGGRKTYYLNVETPCPYPEDYEFSILKDCPADVKNGL